MTIHGRLVRTLARPCSPAIPLRNRQSSLTVQLQWGDDGRRYLQQYSPDHRTLAEQPGGRKLNYHHHHTLPRGERDLASKSRPPRSHNGARERNEPAKRKWSIQGRKQAQRDKLDSIQQGAERRDVLHFVEAVESSRVSNAIALYPPVADRLAGQSIVATYLILLSKAATKSQHDEQQQASILNAANAVRDDSIRNKLPLSNSVFKRLLHTYRDLKSWDTGVKLWNWMLQQGEDIAHLTNFAAAVELLTMKGDSLEEIENVYRRATSELSAFFIGYHLSPNAILPDRNAENSAALPPDTDILLEKLLQARLQANDWKGSYLLFDTAYRLFQAPRPNMFNFFIAESSSLSEQYTIARMACRSRVPINGLRLQTIIKALIARDRKAPPTDFYMTRRIESFNASLNLVLASYDAHGKFNPLLVASLLKHLSLLIEHAGPEKLREGFAHKVADLGDEFLSAIYPLLTPPALECHNSLMAIGKRADYPELVGRALEKLATRGAWPDNATRRILVSFAGSRGDLDQVRETWSMLLDTAVVEKRTLEGKDWGALYGAVSALHTREGLEFLKSEAQRLDWEIPTASLSYLEELVSKPATADSPSASTIDISAALSSITTILSNAISVVTQIRDIPDYRIDHDSMQMSIGQSSPVAKLTDLWKIYNEISVDSTVRSDPNYTEVPLEKLPEFPVLARRFHDWASLTELMVQADRKMKKDAQQKAVVIEETDSLQQDEKDGNPDDSEDVPREFEALRSYILHNIRGVPRQIVQY